MELLRENWKKAAFGLLAIAVAVAAIVVAVPTPALADEANEPVVLTPETHSFIGYPHHREPWPNEDGSPVEYPFIVEDNRIDVEFGMEADDSAAPHGYVLWQLFDETGKEVFSAYLMGFGYGYASNAFGFVLNAGTYTQRLTQVGCEGTPVNISLIAYTHPDTWVWPGSLKADRITVGSTVDSKFTDPSDVAEGSGLDVKRYYKDFEFSLDDPTNVKVSAKPINGETQLSLLDSEGSLLKSATSPYDAEEGTFGAYDLDCGRLPAGTYYIRYEALELPDKTTPAKDREFTLSAKAGHEVYRLYNSHTGEHFYTASASERDTMVAGGWTSEGIMWYAPLKSDYPIYRLYNPFTGDHHFASTLNEYNELGESGWTKEGIVFYSLGNPEDASADGVVIDRFYNPYNPGPGSHMYANSEGAGKAEFDQLVASGWTHEGTGWTGLSWA